MGTKNIVQRNQAMDILRVLACLGVITTHACGSVIVHHFAEKGSNEWMFCSILGQSLKWSVPIFVMITGFFFLKPEKELPLKKLYGKYILRLVLALVFWTWFYAISLHSLYVGFYPFGGQDTNFWYVGMCIGLYMSMPVLRLVAANDRVLAYSCWIWLFIRFYLFFGRLFPVPIVLTDYVFTGYVGYCLWGYYLYRLNLSRKQTRIVYLVGLLSWIISAALPLVTDNKVRFSMEDPGPILMSIAIFLYVIKHPVHLSPKHERIVSHLSSMTFGIYMAHTFVLIEAFTRLYRFIPNIYLLVPASIVVAFVSSYIIVLIIKQIPFLKKWVV